MVLTDIFLLSLMSHSQSQGSSSPLPLGTQETYSYRQSRGPDTSSAEGPSSASGCSTEPHHTVTSLYCQSSLATVPFWELAFLPFTHYRGESHKDKHQRPEDQRSACLVCLKTFL